MQKLNEHSSIRQYLAIQEEYYQEMSYFLNEKLEANYSGMGDPLNRIVRYPVVFKGRWYDNNKYKYAFLLKKLYQLKCNSCSILDVGCGDGTLDYILMKEGFDVTASDYHDDEGSRQFSRVTGIPYVKFNLNADEGFPETYDVVICSEVLEHTHINLKNGIKKLLTACHKDSILIITLPNIYSINNLIRICRGINIVEDFPDEIVMKDDIVLDLRQHKRECTKIDLLCAASANNLKLIEYGTCYTTTAFTHPYLAKIIPPPLRPHIYGIFSLNTV